MMPDTSASATNPPAELNSAALTPAPAQQEPEAEDFMDEDEPVCCGGCHHLPR